MLAVISSQKEIRYSRSSGCYLILSYLRCHPRTEPLLDYPRRPASNAAFWTLSIEARLLRYVPSDCHHYHDSFLRHELYQGSESQDARVDWRSLCCLTGFGMSSLTSWMEGDAVVQLLRTATLCKKGNPNRIKWCVCVAYHDRPIEIRVRCVFGSQNPGE